MQHLEEIGPGTRVGNHVIDEPLGCGSFGDVHRALGPNGEHVAIKISKRTTRNISSQELLFLQNEIETLTRLDHPSLIRMHSCGFLNDGRVYLVMDLAVGTRLDRYLSAHGRLDVLETIPMVAAIARALAHIHDNNLLHLDLKPANIVLTDPHGPTLKLLDFGLSTVRERWRPRSSSPVGTPAYMAPEILAREDGARLGPQADLYSLGTIFYELLVGERPFASAGVWQKLVADPPPITARLPDLPPNAAALVHALLARAPEARPRRAAEVAMQLESLYYAVLGAPAEGPPALEATPPVAEAIAPNFAAACHDAPWVGRKRELALLQGSLQALIAGVGGRVLLRGDAGMGKSRLVIEALERHGRNHDTWVCYGRSRQRGQLVPYSPLREALGDLAASLRTHLGDTSWEAAASWRERVAKCAQELTDVVPELQELSSKLSNPTEPTAPAEKGVKPSGVDWLARPLATLLRTVGERTPVVVVIEDLHWADEGTLLVLERLLEDLTDAPVLLWGTSRDTVPTWRGEARTEVQWVEIGPLSDADNTALMHALATSSNLDTDIDTAAQPGTSNMVAEVKRSVPIVAAGNPLCTTQVMYSLELEGYLSRRDGGPLGLARPIDPSYEPPASVSRVVARVLEHLSPSVLDVLSVGALIGRTFRRSDLSALGLFPSEAVDAALATATTHGLGRIDGDLCTLSHDVLTTALEQTLSDTRRPDIHRRIARYLETQGHRPGTFAHHLEGAREILPAAEAYLEAALNADRLHSPTDARRLVEKSFHLLQQLSTDPHRNTLWVRCGYELARIACLAGDTGGIVEALDQLREGLSAESRVDAKLALESAYARVHYAQGDFPKALAASQACLETPATTPAQQTFQCAPANIVGRALSATGKFGPSIPLLQRGCDLARNAEEYVELSHSEGLLGVSKAFAGQFEAAQAHMESAELVAQRLEDPVRILGAHFYFASLGEASCDWSLGLTHSTDLIYFAEKSGVGGLYLYLGTMFAGRHHFHLGLLDRSRVLLLNALNLARVFKIRIGLSWTLAFLGDTHFVRRDYEAAARAYEQGAKSGPGPVEDDYGGPMCLGGLMHLAAREDNATEVRRRGQEALLRLEKAGNLATQATVLARFAESLEDVGAKDEAAKYLQQRADLEDALSGRITDFWPTVPHCADSSMSNSARSYWASYDPANSSSDPGSVPSATRPATPTEPASLLESLSIIEGYVPVF